MIRDPSTGDVIDPETITPINDRNEQTRNIGMPDDHTKRVGLAAIQRIRNRMQCTTTDVDSEVF